MGSSSRVQSERRSAVLLAALVTLAAGCNSNPLGTIQVASASITGVQWSSFDLVIGGSWASGVLHIVDTSGVSHTANVTINGPALGAAFDISGGDFSSTTISLTLPANTPITGADLFETYVGDDVGIHIGIGGEQHDLSNSAGVSLSGGTFDFGIGVFVGLEWLNISLAGSGGSSGTSTTSIAGSTGGTTNAASTASASSSSGHSSSSSSTAAVSSTSSSASSTGSTSASSSSSSSTSSSSGAPIIEVSLSDAAFATTGVNLFNCSTPAQPPSPTSLSTGPIVCNPLPSGSGYSTTPVVVDQVVGCGNESAAVVQVTCSGTPASRDVSGSVLLAITGTLPGSCAADIPDGGLVVLQAGTDGGAPVESDGGAGPFFDFDFVVPSGSAMSQPLGACAAFTNFCTPTDVCDFNIFSATVSVSNVGP